MLHTFITNQLYVKHHCLWRISNMALALKYRSSGSLSIKQIFSVSIKKINSISIFKAEWHSAFLMSLYWEHLVITRSSVYCSLRAQTWQILCYGRPFVMSSFYSYWCHTSSHLCHCTSVFLSITLFKYCLASGENLNCLYVLNLF